MERNSDGVLEAHYVAPVWRHGEQVVRHLRKHFGARVLYRAEGPDARRWSLSISGMEIRVDQWDTDDLTIYGVDPEAEGFITRIAESIRAETT